MCEHTCVVQDNFIVKNDFYTQTKKNSKINFIR